MGNDFHVAQTGLLAITSFRSKSKVESRQKGLLIKNRPQHHVTGPTFSSPPWCGFHVTFVHQSAGKESQILTKSMLLLAKASILTQDQNSFSIQEAKTGRHHQAGSVPARWRSRSAPGKPRKSPLNRHLHS